MAEQELTIEISDLHRFQVYCGNPDCQRPEATYETRHLATGFEKKCPVCGTAYPIHLVKAIEHYLLFLGSAAESRKKAKTRISLQVRVVKASN